MERRKIDKVALASVIRELDGLTNEQRADLLALLNERKSFGLVWEEKEEEAQELLREQLPVLKEVPEKRLTDGGADAPNHILIEADNLHAVTALMYTHEGKFDAIYIDPPYNTGNKDWKYNNDYVDSTDEYRHSKWVSFMNHRLLIAKKLLSPEGVLITTIDDNEYANLLLLLQKHFPERQHFSVHIQHNPRGGQGDKFAVTNETAIFSLTKNSVISRKSHLDDDKSSFRKWGNQSLRSLQKRATTFFPIIVDQQTLKVEGFGPVSQLSEHPKANVVINGKLYVYPIDENNIERKWRYSVDNENEIIESLSAEKNKRTGIVNIYISRNSENTKTIWVDEKYNAEIYGTKLIHKILPENDFPYPKSLYAVEDCLWHTTHHNPNALILDFFAGSGTTLHATMMLNEEDGGHRQCILVTNNENNICEEVTYERNKRVINGYTTPKGVEVEGLHHNNLRYYKVDFVPRDNSIAGKRKLMEASTDLICIKHDVYQEQERFGSLKLRPSIARYFEEKGKQILIIYKTEAIEYFVNEIAQMPEGTNVLTYVFSTNNYALEADFEEVADKVTLCALPAAIYNAYLKVLPKKKMADTEEEAENAEPTNNEEEQQ